MLLYLCPLSAGCESVSVSVPFILVQRFPSAGGQTREVDPMLG